MSGERSRGAARAVDEAEPAGTGAALCAGCGAPAEGPRCGGCGAASTAGSYRALKVLHQSAHSRVYLAASAGGERVALKELLFATAPDAKALDDFAREGALLRELHHPSIPRFVDAFTEGAGAATRFYLAQEFVEGETLLARLASHRFSGDEVHPFAEQLLDVLDYLHGLSPPVLHRDVKPANLILRPDGRLVLVDFGSAREVKPGGTHRATLTGTFGYLPPEALGGSVDQTTDLYGVGATLLHLLSRRPPEELLWSAEGVSLAAQLNAPPQLVAWLTRLTAARRTDRFQSAEEARQALHSPHLPALAQPAAPVQRWGPMGKLGYLLGRGVRMALDASRRRRFSPKRVLLSATAFAVGAGCVALAKLLWAHWRP